MSAGTPIPAQWTCRRCRDTADIEEYLHFAWRQQPLHTCDKEGYGRYSCGLHSYGLLPLCRRQRAHAWYSRYAVWYASQRIICSMSCRMVCRMGMPYGYTAWDVAWYAAWYAAWSSLWHAVWPAAGLATSNVAIGCSGGCCKTFAFFMACLMACRVAWHATLPGVGQACIHAIHTCVRARDHTCLRAHVCGHMHCRAHHICTSFQPSTWCPVPFQSIT